METAMENQNIASKLVEIMKECSHVLKNGTNSYHGYTYATCADVLEMINASLVKHKICSAVTPELLSLDEITDAKGKPARLATVKVNIDLIDSETGEMLSITGMGSGQDANDKAVMKAQTAAIKYAYLMSFAIRMEDDPEQEEPAAPQKREGYGDRQKAKASDTAPFPSRTALYCSSCGASITEKVASYSRQRFGRLLCINCQHEHRQQAG